MEKYLFLLAIVLITVTGQILLKSVANQLTPQLLEIRSFDNLLQNVFIILKNYKVLSVIPVYAIAFFIWFFTLTKFELSNAFPITASIIYILILLFSWLFLKENIGVLRMAGTLLIVMGVFLIAKS